MIVAAVDVGTNSTRLLVAELDLTQRIKVLHTDLKTTRLGEGINSGMLTSQAMERTLTVVEQFVRQARVKGAQAVILAATSAVRDAANGKEFSEIVERRTGIPLSILPGEKEAELSYQGVVAALDAGSNDVVVMDVGGGSTEFSWKDKGVVRYCSVNVGAVRMTEGAHSNREIKELLKPSLKEMEKRSDFKLVAVGGTATTMAAMIQGLRVYDSEKVHGFKVTLSQANDLLEKISAVDLEERRRMPGLQPERADIIPAGVRIVKVVFECLGLTSFTASEADILWGLILQHPKV
ncbi:MAG: Ppx/GppA family phosphatase [Firmicutes bacterium]|nr:Ppx/GppA family phosphatase [Bacillota bacterium]